MSDDERPSVMPLFPLPNVVLLPGMVLPLNVFEPRYLELVDHVLDGGMHIGVPLLRLAAEGSAEDRTILRVKVEEKSTGSLSFGAGFSTEAGPIGSVSRRRLRRSLALHIATSTRLPRRAAASASAALTVVLPTPPLPMTSKNS